MPETVSSRSTPPRTYRPEGPGHRARTARVDLSRIPAPEAWLTNRLGPLASFEMRPIVGADIDAPDANCVVSADPRPYALAIDTGLKRQGMRSSMRLTGWPLRMAVMVAAR